MRITILNSPDALEPAVDPFLDQLSSVIESLHHQAERVTAGPDVATLVSSLRRVEPELIFNLAESFAGKSALESNVAMLLNLMGYRYTGSSPAGLLLAGDKILSKKLLRFHGIRTPEFATMYRGAVDWADKLTFPVIVKPPQE